MGGRLFWSDDFGAAPSWKDATPRLEGALASSPGLPPAMRGVVDVFAHADAPCRLLVQGAGALHWTTADCGRTFTPAPAPAGTAGWFADFKLHPTQPSWILSKVRRAECHRRGAAGSKWCAYDLFVSQDFAGTWTNLTAASGGAVASFWDYDWGANLLKAGRAPGSAVKDATIFATAYESARHMKGPYPGWDKDMHFVASHDFFRSAHAKVASCGNQFEVVGRTLYLAMPADCPVHPDGSARPKRAAGGGGGGGGPGGGSNVVLYTSADEGATWLQACLPVKWMDLGYSLVRTHDAASALVVVDHDEEDPAAAAAPAGNVYSPGSGETGAPIFTLALPRTYRTASASDFARVEGLPGVFMANQIDGDAFAGGGGAGKPGRRAFESYVRTRVSFNGGARWQDLAPPADPRHAACRRCVPDAGDGDGGASCALHLHGPSSWHDGPGGRPSFYSHANAPGVVMAVGNAGRHLDRAADALCTWMSRDGGVSWSDVAPRASIYEFGDHGGLLAMARHEVDGPAESISFSSDQGACWHEVHLAEAIDVQNIRIEPRGASHVFIVHGKACRRSPTHQACGWDAAGGGAGGGGAASSPPGRMYVLDVRTLMGPDWRECGAGDYERWAPAAAAGGCLLGANVTVERRVGAAQCFNGREYVRSNGTAPGKSGRAASPSDAAPPCPCTLNDVECEYGYERAGADCVPIAGFDLGAAAGRCAALGGGRFGGASHAPYRASTTKRRLVHGDTCSGVSSVIPDTDGRGHGRGMGRAGGLLKGLAWAVAGVATLAGVAAAAAAVRGGGGGGPAALSTASAIAGGLAESASSFLASTAGRVADAVSGSRAGGAARAAAADAFFQPLAGGEGEGTALLAPGGGELGGLSAADLAAAEVI
jgi:sortilin